MSITFIGTLISSIIVGLLGILGYVGLRKALLKSAVDSYRVANEALTAELTAIKTRLDTTNSELVKSNEKLDQNTEELKEIKGQLSAVHPDCINKAIGCLRKEEFHG